MQRTWWKTLAVIKQLHLTEGEQLYSPLRTQARGGEFYAPMGDFPSSSQHPVPPRCVEAQSEALARCPLPGSLQASWKEAKAVSTGRTRVTATTVHSHSQFGPSSPVSVFLLLSRLCPSSPGNIRSQDTMHVYAASPPGVTDFPGHPGNDCTVKREEFLFWSFKQNFCKGVSFYSAASGGPWRCSTLWGTPVQLGLLRCLQAWLWQVEPGKKVNRLGPRQQPLLCLWLWRCLCVWIAPDASLPPMIAWSKGLLRISDCPIRQLLTVAAAISCGRLLGLFCMGWLSPF